MSTNKTRFSVAAQRSIQLLCVAIFIFIQTLSFGETKSPEQIEYELKAAFIYNFLRFIQWPKEKLPPIEPPAAAAEEQTPPPPVIIAIVGKNPFGNAFEHIVGKLVHQRPIQIRFIEGLSSFKERFEDKMDADAAYQEQFAQSLKESHLVFICPSEKAVVSSLLKMLEGASAVAVSDIPDFATNGGIIGFVLEKNKIRFDINLVQAQKEKLAIRSELLELARKVYKK